MAWRCHPYAPRASDLTLLHSPSLRPMLQLASGAPLRAAVWAMTRVWVRWSVALASEVRLSDGSCCCPCRAASRHIASPRSFVASPKQIGENRAHVITEGSINEMQPATPAHMVVCTPQAGVHWFSCVGSTTSYGRSGGGLQPDGRSHIHIGRQRERVRHEAVTRHTK